MAARSIRTFTVLPNLPERLQALQGLAYNLWWCWHHDAISLFRRIDPDLFDAMENSPVKLLGAVDQARMNNCSTTTVSWPTWIGSKKPSRPT